MDAELSGNKKEGGREPSILMRNLKEEDSGLILATGNMILENERGYSISFISRSPFAGLGHCFHKVLQEGFIELPRFWGFLQGPLSS